MSRALLIVSSLLIAGCDTFYGVTRDAQISRVIDYKCIEQSLKTVAEVTDIKYQFMGGQSSATSDKNKSYRRHRYHYKTGDVNGFISILTNDNGTRVSQFSLANIRPPPQEDIDKIRPIMDKIEIAIAHSCSVSNFPTLVRETCIKVECN